MSRINRFKAEERVLNNPHLYGVALTDRWDNPDKFRQAVSLAKEGKIAIPIDDAEAEYQDFDVTGKNGESQEKETRWFIKILQFIAMFIALGVGKVAFRGDIMLTFIAVALFVAVSFFFISVIEKAIYGTSE